MKEWKSYKLGDISIIQTGPFGSQLHQSDYVKSGVPCIMPTNIGGMLDFQVTEIAHITEDNAHNLSRHIVHEGDIVYSRRGDIEKCAYVTREQDGWFCGTGCLKITINPDLAVPKFVAYLLSTTEIKRWIVGNAVGTTMLNLNTSVLSDVPVSLPSLNTQRRCVQILDSLENKISLNTRINHNLEEQAQALYESWFVDFEPFGGIIPDTWETGLLSDILSLKRETIKKEQVSDLPYLPIDLLPMHSFSVDSFANNSEAQSSLQLFSKNDILIGAMRVYFHRVVPAPCRGVTRNTCFVLRPVSDELFGYALMTCNQNSTIAFAQRTSKGSTMPYAVWDGALSNMNVLIPDDNTMKRFNAIIQSIIETIQNNSVKNARLRALRDSLLPKLMEGNVFDLLNSHLWK